MTMTPLPTQLSGAAFLASRKRALLADAPRVGKTGAAILAADYILAPTILIVTTASGRGVWLKAMGNWSVLGRSVEIMTPSNAAKIRADVVIVGWPSIANPKVRSVLLRRRWGLLLLDESHYAKNFEAARTRAVYGTERDAKESLVSRAEYVWALSGTPIPHNPSDLFPMMKRLFPERLHGVETFEAFRKRYCIVRMKSIGNGFNRIPVIIGGRNEDEVWERLRGNYILRTQADVGIRAPIYETLPLIVSDKMKREATSGLDATRVLLAAERGDTRELDMHLGPLRRLTGEIKAQAVVDAVRDEFESGTDKIVLMYWHRDVGQILKEGLAKFGVVGIDGSTPAKARDAAVASFRLPDGPRVFLGQIVAAGEAIDLSAAAELIFVETSMVPKDMAQASLRITNHSQKRQARVRVATLMGSIDEAIQARLMMLWATIRKVMK